MNNRFLKILIFGSIAVLLLAVLIITLISSGLANSSESASVATSVSASAPVSAEEIYPLFLCPCCGQPLDKNNICCEAAKEMVDYIDSLAAEGKSEKEIILSFVKKYGLNSFVDGTKAEELREELIKIAPEERPQIVINQETYDFGDVSQKEGIATTFFELKNNGQSDLIIDKLETSCGCTSASIVYQSKEGPKFSMPGHGINEEIEDWQISIAPGASAQLKIYYDPDVHLDFRGAATREIYIYSNDPIDFQKKVKIELNQVD